MRRRGTRNGGRRRNVSRKGRRKRGRIDSRVVSVGGSMKRRNKESETKKKQGGDETVSQAGENKGRDRK